jgi:hypothetical protein
MAWFLIVVLTIVAVLALLAILALAGSLTDDTELERRRIEMEVHRAERHLHDLARNSFQAMLEEARTHGRGGVG